MFCRGKEVARYKKKLVGIYNIGNYLPQYYYLLQEYFASLFY
jgi:hypothetical protein